jgi:hypothetical protein
MLKRFGVVHIVLFCLYKGVRFFSHFKNREELVGEFFAAFPEYTPGWKEGFMMGIEEIVKYRVR